jgi:hypothetical protein
MSIPDIDLTEAERALLAQIDFDTERVTFEDQKRNGEAAARFLKSLLARNAIPQQRLKYFLDPAFRSSRQKGRRWNLIDADNNILDETARHPNFLPYLYYFVHGPRLPRRARERFHTEVKRRGRVSSSDAVALAEVARAEARSLGLQAHTASEEYLKLALDCEIPSHHALSIRDHLAGSAR